MGDDDIHYMIKYTTQNSITGRDISLKSQKKREGLLKGGSGVLSRNLSILYFSGPIDS